MNTMNDKERYTILELDENVRKLHSDSEWIDMFVNLAKCIVVGANFNSKASEVGCSIFNMGQILSGLERNNNNEIKDKLCRPYSNPLLAGNEEEEDNIFIEYVSRVEDTSEFDVDAFHMNKVGLFTENLMKQDLPRPTKSCRPDWVHQYEGCPLAYGEGKTTKGEEGLHYSQICATNILNYLPVGEPSLLLYSSGNQFIMQAARLCPDSMKIKVIQRKGIPYVLTPTSEDPMGRGLTHRLGHRPRPTRSLKMPITYTLVETKKCTDQQLAMLRLRATTEALAEQKELYNDANTLREAIGEGSLTAAVSYDIERLYEDLDKNEFIIGVAEHYPKVSMKFEKLARNVQWYITSLFEAVDVCTTVFLYQNQEQAKINYHNALEKKMFRLPVKYTQGQVSYRRAVESNLFLYENVENWDKLSFNNRHWQRSQRITRRECVQVLPVTGTVRTLRGAVYTTPQKVPEEVEDEGIFNPSPFKIGSVLRSTDKWFTTPEAQQYAAGEPTVTGLYTTPMSPPGTPQTVAEMLTGGVQPFPSETPLPPAGAGRAIPVIDPLTPVSTPGSPVTQGMEQLNINDPMSPVGAGLTVGSLLTPGVTPFTPEAQAAATPRSTLDRLRGIPSAVKAKFTRTPKK